MSINWKKPFEWMSDASIEHSLESYCAWDLVWLTKEGLIALANWDIEALDGISWHSDAATELVKSLKEWAKIELDLRDLIG